MPDTRTERLHAMADHLWEPGLYTASNSVRAITAERDQLLASLTDLSDSLDGFFSVMPSRPRVIPHDLGEDTQESGESRHGDEN